MISSGIAELNAIIDGYGKEITMIYGAPATGKTTLCLIAAIDILNKNKKFVMQGLMMKI